MGVTAKSAKTQDRDRGTSLLAILVVRTRRTIGPMMSEAPFTPSPLPPWTEDRKVADLHDALAHVLADAFSVTAMALFAQWNTDDRADPAFVDVFRSRVRAGRSAQETIARRMRALGGPIMLHPSDPSEVPRWMLSGQSHDPVAEMVLLAAATYEFVRSVEATVEVAREIPDRDSIRALQRMRRREEKAIRMLHDLAGATTETLLDAGATTRH